MKKSQEKGSPLRVLIINYEFPPLGGGGGVATYDLALEWAKKGEVDVLTSSFKGLPAFEKVENINIHRVKVWFRKSRDAASFTSMLTYLPYAFFKGISLFRSRHYDVINTHFAVPSGPLGYLFGRMFKTPNVLSLHGGDIYDPSKKMSPHNSFFFKRVVRFILRKADAVVAQSSNTRENALKYYSPGREISVIPLAFHPPRLPKVTRKELGLSKEDFVLVAIGRIVKRKALDVLISALGQISDSRIRLFILGDGPERETLQEQARSLGLENRVAFLGYVSEEDKYRYLAAADLFALTSMHEGFGIVYMEAMHCGLPIICSDHGGQVDFLTHEKNALIIEVGNVEQCARHILRYQKDRKLYDTCSRNNRVKVQDFYAEAIAGQYLDLFHKLVN